MNRYLTQNELNQLLGAAKKVNCPLAQRDYHVMAALAKSGCRIQEFSLLTVGDVYQSFKTGYLFIPKEHRKGKRTDHSVFVTDILKKHLTALLMMTDADGADSPLVPGRNGGHFSVRSYQDRIKQWASAAGLSPKISPHWLRHTRAMDILKNSSSQEPLRTIKRALGHTNINTTMEYLKMDREEFETTLNDTDGIVGRRKNMKRLRQQYEKSVLA